MTNKKKARGSAKKSKTASSSSSTKDDASGSTSSSTVTTTANGNGNSVNQGLLSLGQMSALIYLSLGLSKLVEWHGAVFAVSDDEDSLGKNTICESYLRNLTSRQTTTTTAITEDDDPSIALHPCEEDGTKIWIRLKLYTGIQLAWVVITLVAFCWKEEDFLMGVLLSLCACPLGFSIYGLLFSCRSWLYESKSFQLVLLCFVLIALVFPTGGPNNNHSFSILRTSLLYRRRQQRIEQKRLKGRRLNYQYVVSLLPSFCISALFFLRIWHVFRAGTTLLNLPVPPPVEEEENGETDALSASWTMEETFGITSTLPVESLAIVFFWMVDQISVALLLFFVWFFFDPRRQRNFLLSMCICNFVEYFSQLDYFTEEQVNNIESMKTIVLYCAIFSGVSWLLPTAASLDTASKAKTA